MKKILFLLSFIVLGLEIQAQVNVIPYRKGDKWGYCDKNKKILLEPKYEAVTFFDSNRFAKVQKKTKWGVVDSKFTEIIPPKYIDLQNIKNTSFFQVNKNNKWAIVNPVGKRVTKYKNAFVHKVLLKKYFLLKYSHSKKSGLIDFKGKQVIPARYTMITSTGQKDLFLVSKNNKQGVYDILLKREIIPVEYDKVEVPDYHKYFKLVRDGKMGMCNSEHKMIVPIKHDQVYKQGKFILVKNNGKQGYYSTEGSLIIPIKYDQGDYDGQKKAFFMSKGDKLWIYKTEGKLIETIKKPAGWKPREMIEVVSGSTDDNVEVNLVFEIPSAEPLKPHKKGEKWGFNRGKKNIIPHKYDVVWSFYDGFARVKYKGKFGYINEKGVEYFED